MLLSIILTINVYASGDAFDEWKKSCIEAASEIPFDNSATEECMGFIENYYSFIVSLTEWPSGEEEIPDEFSLFTVGIAYFDSNFDEDSIGKSIAKDGWELLASLYFADGKFAKKASTFKNTYETGTGKLLFNEKYQEGQHKVGSDIPAGEYVIVSDWGSGYFCVSSDANGSDIIANDNFTYNSIISVNDGEYLQLKRCYAVPISEATSIPIDKANMFLIGTHLPAGEYCLEAEENGYYCIYADNRHKDIIANDNFEGKSYVTVSDGQYLLLSRCNIQLN